jgi:hypothetical protein
MLGRHFVSKQLRPAAAPVQHLISKRTQMSAAKTALDEMEKGEFKRTAAGFRCVRAALKHIDEPAGKQLQCTAGTAPTIITPISNHCGCVSQLLSPSVQETTCTTSWAGLRLPVTHTLASLAVAT